MVTDEVKMSQAPMYSFLLPRLYSKPSTPILEPWYSAAAIWSVSGSKIIILGYVTNRRPYALRDY